MPRLLYVGDVPIEASYHGSLFLFRLLESYLVHKLTIVETGNASESSRRITGVNYISVPLARPRWLNTRFHGFATAWYSLKNSQSHGRIMSAISGVEFDSILTVAHGFGWLTAASIARKKKVPLHLIIHDDWPRVVDVPGPFQKWIDRKFADVYRQAASRMCVSPFMRARYLERYGADSVLLYPTRAADCSVFDAPPTRLSLTNKPFTVAFAGSINSDGYIRALLQLCQALARVNGKLLLFGPITLERLSERGLGKSNLSLGGLLDSAELIIRLREEADALFVPMSFDSEDRSNMEMAFPSKLADYTATGLPLLIYGPSYCSAVRWARKNSGTAEIVDAENDASLSYAVKRLAEDSGHRVSLATRALTVGQRYFGHGVAQRSFDGAIRSANVLERLT